jgi:uncharacterized protein (DUF433 family)
MNKSYVEMRDGVYWITGSRVSLDSVVLAFLDGLSPESIAGEGFSTLSLEQVYGAIAYYLANRAEIDAYLDKADTEFDALRQSVEAADPAFARKLTEARRRISTNQP